jgi:hypothetical protein
MRKRITLISGILIAGFLIAGFWFYRNWSGKNLEEESQKTPIEETNINREKSREQESEESVVTKEINTKQPINETEEPVVELANESENTEKVEETTELKNLNPVYITQIKSLFNLSNFSIDNLPEGKTYFHGENGKLESVIHKGEDGISEQLVSYDYRGQKTDALEIGWIDGAGQVVKYAVISGNKISIFETLNTKKKKETKVTEYAITPQLKFTKGKIYMQLL